MAGVIVGKRQALKQVPEIGIGFKAVCLCCLDQAEERCARICSPGVAGKQPVLSPYYKLSYRVFGYVVIDRQSTIFDVYVQLRPVVQRILNRLAQ